MKLISLLLFLTLSVFSFAQPNAAQIKVDIKKDFPTATVIDPSATGSTTKEYVNGGYQNVYRCNVNVTVPSSNPKYPNVKIVYRGAVLYRQSGSGYSYAQFSPGDERLIGMPDPNKAEVIAFLDAKMSEIFVASKYDFIDKPASFQLAPEIKFEWLSFTHFSFIAFTTYSTMPDGKNISENIKHFRRISIYADEQGNWEKAIASAPGDRVEREILSKKEYSSTEKSQLLSWGEKVDRIEAEAIWASLPKMEIPNFKDVYEAAEFVNGIFLEGDEAKTRALLYYMMPQSGFRAPDFRALSRWGNDFTQKIIPLVALNEFRYGDQYCPTVDVKNVQDGNIDIYNKDKSTYTRFSFGLENGTWKIFDITSYVLTDPEIANRLKATECSKTSLSVLERGTREGNANLKVKDYVLAYYESDGLWYPAFYLGYENYYYSIQYFMDNSKGKVRKAVPLNLQAGDIAYVKTQSGTLVEVVVKSVNGTDVVIVFNGQDTPYKMSGLLFK